MRHADKPRCPLQGKVMHETRESAQAHQRSINGARNNQGRNTIRRCHVCDHYHVGRR